MEDKIFDIFDNLSIEETSLLLERDFDMHIDKKVEKRIINSVKKKSHLNFSSNESILDKLKNSFSSLLLNKKLATLCTIFVLFLTSGGYIYTQSPVTYVSLDINPSIELGLNRFDKVVSYEAYNSDGEILLDSNNKKHIPVDNAINNIISAAVRKNYISTNKNPAVAFSTISNDSIARKELEIHLKDTLETSLENLSVDASIISSNNELAKREEAKNIGFTVSKLLLVKELKSLDSNITIEKFKHTPIANIENRILKLKNKDSDSVNKNTLDTKNKVDNTTNNNSSSNKNKDNGISTRYDNSNNNKNKDKDISTEYDNSNSNKNKDKDIPTGYDNSNSNKNKDKDISTAYDNSNSNKNKDKDISTAYDNSNSNKNKDKDISTAYDNSNSNKDKNNEKSTAYSALNKNKNKGKEKSTAYDNPNSNKNKDKEKSTGYSTSNKNKNKNKNRNRNIKYTNDNYQFYENDCN